MGRGSSANPDFLNGVPELLALRALERQPMHGYDVVRAIERASGGRLHFGEGCIYPILHRLEAGGQLESTREKVGGRMRIVYRLTSAGHARLAESQSAWQAAVEAVTLALQGCTDGRTRLA